MDYVLSTHEIHGQEKLCDYELGVVLRELGLLLETVSQRPSILVLHQHVDVLVALINFEELDGVAAVCKLPLNLDLLHYLLCLMYRLVNEDLLLNDLDRIYLLLPHGLALYLRVNCLLLKLLLRAGCDFVDSALGADTNLLYYYEFLQVLGANYPVIKGPQPSLESSRIMLNCELMADTLRRERETMFALSLITSDR